MLELTLELPAELASRKRTGKVWIYDRDKRPLAAGGFVLEPSSDWQTLRVPLAKTGIYGLAVLWNVWIESWGLKGFARVNRALGIDEGTTHITILFDLQYSTKETR